MGCLPESELAKIQLFINKSIIFLKKARIFICTAFLFNVFYAPVMMIISLSIPFLFISSWIWGTIITLLLALYTPIFFFTSPHKNGNMVSPKLRSSFFVEDVIQYFSGKLFKTNEFDPSKQYIFGYHPHGILPFAELWVSLSPEWKMFQTDERETVTLITSLLFSIPITREFMAAVGCRDVSKASFKYALDQGNSVVLIPGGVKEMKESLTSMEDIVLCKSHKGFVRMAIIHGVDLVPMFSFGETKLLDLAFPTLQKIFWKNLGLPLPIFKGRWGLPMPHPQQLKIIIGPSIHVSQNLDPSDEEVDAIAKEYFNSLEEIFEKYKHSFGYGQSKIIWK